MKKKLLIVASSAAVAMVATLSITAFNSGIFSANAIENPVWHHYAAVEPTETMHGSKEFWASSADGCKTHQFTDPGLEEYVEHDFSTYESFQTLSYGDDRYVPTLFESRNGVYPKINGDNTISYGIYPQKHINNALLINALNALTTPESNGWYLYDGAYYTKIIATPYESGYKFDDHGSISDGYSYWFKCEPIIWNILSSDNGEYYVVSSNVLDIHLYHHSTEAILIDEEEDIWRMAANYEYSDIRDWLNEEFYNTVFQFGDECVQTTLVDNSLESTGDPYNSSLCEDTLDKIFLPSKADYMNSEYGFSGASSRYCWPSDYAKAIGARSYLSSYQTLHSDYDGCGEYWMRSPAIAPTNHARYSSYSGTISGMIVDTSSVGVRPAMVVRP